ncbi:MAG: amidohydrolase family protein [Alphaproteobacteria bacterium]|nr:amidohydrolase family protein [Alphaproteobacteria bacterium]
MTRESTSFVIEGARVYRHERNTDNPLIQAVLVRDGRIAHVGDDIPASNDVRRVNLADHILVPGFVNGHYHSHDVLAKGMFETMSLERWGLIAGAIGGNRSADEVHLRTVVGAVECVRNGITTIQDFLNLAPYDPKLLDAVIDAYESVGVRVILGVTVRDKSQLDTILWANEMIPPEQHAIVGTQASDGPSQLAFIAEQMKRHGNRGGKLIWAVNPSAPQRCSFDLLKAIQAFRKQHNVPIYTHVYETRLQRLFAQEKLGEFGGSAINYLASAGLVGSGVTIAHGVWPDADEIQKIADTGTGVVLNILSNLKLRSGVAPLHDYRRLGVPLSLGCDNCSCSDSQSMLQVMKLYCLLAGISHPGPERPMAAEAIRLATRGGAAAARLEREIGAIEVGMQADFVAYDMSNPAWRPFNSAARQLVFAETGAGVRHVWVGGRQVVADGKSTMVDEGALMRRLAEKMPAVRKDIDALSANADLVEDAFQAIQARAFNRPMLYDRYLTRTMKN